jgi:hypothetical protein
MAMSAGVAKTKRMIARTMRSGSPKVIKEARGAII